MNVRSEFGKVLRQERIRLPLTLHELSALSGVSPSHLGRIERGERFPSANVLKKIAKPLGLEEDEIFTLAGYLSPQVDSMAKPRAGYSNGRLDPYVSKILSQEPVEVQRSIIGLLAILKSIAKSTEGPAVAG